MFRKNSNSRSQATLLNSGAPDLRRDTEVPDAVISTWETSFVQIHKQYLAAANLSSLVSMFSQQGIPEFLIKAETRHEDSQSDNDGSLQDPESEFEQAIELLIAFSLVRAETNGQFFEMHRLVQLATRRWLQSNNSIQEWKSNAIARMANNFPDGKYENWKICAMLLPHAKEVIAYQTADRESSLQRADVLGNVGWYEAAVGHHDISTRLREQALSIELQYLNKDDIQIGISMANLGLAYQRLRQWKKAEDLQLKGMNIPSGVP
jgi:tetratricopeptide (TPR) repeat protein